MRLLLCLAEHAGEVISIDDLLNQVWPDVTVAPDSVYQAVTSLRRLLGDDPRQPTYIATVPRLGYRLVATVSPWVDQSAAQTGASLVSDSAQAGLATSDTRDAQKKPSAGIRAIFTWAAGAALGLALVGAFLFHGKFPNGNHSASAAIALPPQKSMAVLPFLDLTDTMS